MAKYAILIYEDPTYYANLSPEARPAIVDAHSKFVEQTRSTRAPRLSARSAIRTDHTRLHSVFGPFATPEPPPPAGLSLSPQMCPSLTETEVDPGRPPARPCAPAP